MPLKDYDTKKNGKDVGAIAQAQPQDYANTFNTPAGAKVLADLNALYFTNPIMPQMTGPSVEMQAGAHNVMAFIALMIGDK